MDLLWGGLRKRKNIFDLCVFLRSCLCLRRINSVAVLLFIDSSFFPSCFFFLSLFFIIQIIMHTATLKKIIYLYLWNKRFDQYIFPIFFYLNINIDIYPCVSFRNQFSEKILSLYLWHGLSEPAFLNFLTTSPCGDSIKTLLYMLLVCFYHCFPSSKIKRFYSVKFYILNREKSLRSRSAFAYSSQYTAPPNYTREN